MTHTANTTHRIIVQITPRDHTPEAKRDTARISRHRFNDEAFDCGVAISRAPLANAVYATGTIANLTAYADTILWCVTSGHWDRVRFNVIPA